MPIDFPLAFPCYVMIDQEKRPRTFSAADDEKIQAVAVFTSTESCDEFAKQNPEKGPHGRMVFSNAEDLADYLKAQTMATAKGHPISTLVIDPGQRATAHQCFPLLEFVEDLRSRFDGHSEEDDIQAEFTQERMDHCGQVFNTIMDNWRKNNSFTYIIRAKQPIDGKTLADLQNCEFTVGAGENLFDVEFIDVLVIFQMVAQMAAAMKVTTAKKGTVSFQITTTFTESEAAKILSGLEIETPFDTGKRMRMERRLVPSPVNSE